MTTQNGLYPDVSNVTKHTKGEAKFISPSSQVFTLSVPNLYSNWEVL